jgi:GntR family transcriptional regulator
VLYHRVAEVLRQRIHDGEYEPGQLLPTEAEMVAEHDVSLMTLRRALALLREEGLIVTRRGHPSYVARQPTRRRLTLAPGSRLIGRMPSPTEREALHLERGIPILEVHRADGTITQFAGNQIEIVQPSKPAPITI